MIALIVIGVIAFIGLVLFLFRNSLGAFLRFLGTKLFLINLALALTVAFLVPYCSLSGLESYTNHGVKVEVPNLVGTPISSIADKIKGIDINYLITDSVFSDDYPKGTIIRQDPEPHTDSLPSYVKPERTVYLTIVKLGGEYREVPNLTGDFVKPKSIAKQMLEMQGFIPIFTAKPSKNDYVIELRHKGKVILPGTKLLKGAEIEVIHGGGKEGLPVTLPNIKGLSVLKANQAISQAGLVLDVNYENALNDQDSLFFVVKSQNPSPGSVPQGIVSSGTKVTVIAVKADAMNP